MVSWELLRENAQPRLRDALEKTRPEMQAIAKRDLLPINLDPLAAAGTARGALPKLLPLRARIEQALPEFQLSWLDKLETYALALTQAQVVYLVTCNPPAHYLPIARRVQRGRSSATPRVSVWSLGFLAPQPTVPGRSRPCHFVC